MVMLLLFTYLGLLRMCWDYMGIENKQIIDYSLYQNSFVFLRKSQSLLVNGAHPLLAGDN